MVGLQRCRPKRAWSGERARKTGRGLRLPARNEAKGEAQKFSLLLAEYRKAPDITRRRLYLEAMAAILPNLQKKIIIDDSLKNILPTLPLLPSEPNKTP